VNNIVPRMRTKGFEENQIYKILMDTPRRLMTFVDSIPN
jgi:predicted metal-dependent phosphotriesterase family hydrolase